ncbi:tyrosine-protein phosphatase non-receptor type 4-like [Sitodiplosis mosellana]|nr:tyrosine-protein phosphatase non-receptor type 4-like [Sitodiplosis mosellana]
MNFVDKMREMRQENVESIDHRFKQLQILDADASDISPEEICKRSGKIDDEADDEWIPTSVHQYISAANPPIIVHCSAGIGRTGMLILMDTAISLLNVNEPVYPLDIVKNMRDQRPCMVQNVFQYKFICECIFASYAKLTNTDVAD